MKYAIILPTVLSVTTQIVFGVITGIAAYQNTDGVKAQFKTELSTLSNRAITYGRP